jgi:hypothetical protein
VLRRASYVTDALDPLEIIDSWTFLHPRERRVIKRTVEDALRSASESDDTH